MQGATPADRVGSRLGRHRLTDLLHSTSARAVYRAEEEDTGRLVLLMVLDDQVAAHPLVQERFELRMRQAADVLERHLVPLRSWGVVDGLLCAELGVLAGTGLRTLLEHEPLTPARAVAVLGDLAEAVDAAHSRGLAHLGLSPTVVVVGGDRTARLTDLGLSALLAEVGVLPDPADRSYRSPDQPPQVDPASSAAAALDVWALAALLHDCLTGIGPAAGPVRVPPRLATLVHRGVRGHRWTAATELARAAAAALADGDPAVVLRPRAVPLPEDVPPGPGRSWDDGGDLDATAYRSALPPTPPPAPGARRPARAAAWSAPVPGAVPGSPASGPSGPERPGPGPAPVTSAASAGGDLTPRRRGGAVAAGRARPSRVPLVALVLVALALLTTLAVGWLLVHPLSGAAPVPSGVPTASAPTPGSGPGTAASPAGDPGTEGPGAPPPLPAGATVCEPGGGPVGGLSGSAAGSSRTSCGFAEATRAGLGAEQDPFAVEEIEVTSPVTGEDYRLSCSAEDALITCTGGEAAVVLVW
ncbi:serine/threonine-protein kinase [Auraticoccus monumenti]|uniref:Serine/threonine protein kinase n=1 Tax=Auraticoccus monumenti TaxID=675864 RepID=A0A1G6VY55_9ACTN|nr:hypothetical protein [Auraticoccus monumenti]SDD58562.1 serine/threonine protein kinase [Auraticoccus monumenti]